MGNYQTNCNWNMVYKLFYVHILVMAIGSRVRSSHANTPKSKETELVKQLKAKIKVPHKEIAVLKKLHVSSTHLFEVGSLPSLPPPHKVWLTSKVCKSAWLCAHPSFRSLLGGIITFVEMSIIICSSQVLSLLLNICKKFCQILWW